MMNIVMEYAECGDLSQRIQKQREVEKAFFPEVIIFLLYCSGHLNLRRYLEGHKSALMVYRIVL